MLHRRHFMATSAMLTAGTLSSSFLAANASEKQERKFTMDLRCSSIGVRVGLAEAIELAGKHGFESVAADSSALTTQSREETETMLARMKELKVVWGSAGLPVQFRNDKATFDKDFAQLASRAAALKQAGGARMGTYIMPCHDELTYIANFKMHSDRLRQCAKVLADNGLRMGVEYVGPKTSWTSKRYSFLHSLAGLRDLLTEIHMPNVGVILDSWHWYTAHETVDDLKSLGNEDVVACDLNDAPEGLEIDEQMDLQRELPMATGRIDLATFLGVLVKMGYDGPVRAEPFNAKLNEMDKDQAVAATAEAMKSSFTLVQ